jgi:adenylyltransferase/sulfurtransferase
MGICKTICLKYFKKQLTFIPLNILLKTKIMKSITVQELKAWKDENKEFQLIDVREPYEVEICNIDGISIPMNEIPSRVDELIADKPVVVHCRSGKRSGNVIEFLEQNHQLENLYNLEGGILAWIEEVDNSLEAY